MCVDFRERKGERDQCERNIDQLPCTHPDQESNRNPLAYGTMLQPTEPPDQGENRVGFAAIVTPKSQPSKGILIAHICPSRIGRGDGFHP